jgi:GlpG protein
MRLIGEFQAEKQAFGFQTFLQNHGIQVLYDSTSEGIYRVWVVEEDDFDKALGYYKEWQQNPQPIEPPSLKEQPSLKEHANWKVRMEVPRLRSPFLINNCMIILCGFLFLWTFVQMQRLQQEQGVIALRYELIPLQQELLFDYPEYFVNFRKFFEEYHIRTVEDMKALPLEAQATFKKIENTPTWKGVADMATQHDWTLMEKLPEGTLFGKIRQGELWRLFTPVLLHGGWLHIIFNMLWLFILGRQIEERIGKYRYLLLSLLIGVVANTAQYLVSGPIFLGYSGIITGMLGFIWMRQKKAPWEGYPLQRPVIVFITVFVVAMLILEIASMALQFFHVTNLYMSIANTAHIIGGLFGVLLGRLTLFERSHP